MTTLLHTRGTAHGLMQPTLGKVTRFHENLDKEYFLLTEQVAKAPAGNYLGVLTSERNLQVTELDKPLVYSIPTLSHLQEGDFIVANPEGHLNTLYRVGSRHNSLLVTERCNSNCLMCSQPPKDRDDIPYFFSLYQQLIPMLPKDCGELGITGGEPTLMGDQFFELLHLLKKELPDTELHILTNGRYFSDPEFASRYATLNYQKSMLGIPLYADFYQVHDHVVQAKGAFNQTMKGLYNLAKYDQRIEIRIVLHKLTIPRLYKLSQYIYKNLPFVEHIAFMGLENMGYTQYNFNKLWLDPMDYRKELEESVSYLATRGMNVSIYNSQLCVLPQSLWSYARKSISDWKNVYSEECSQCIELERCGGFFASSGANSQSVHIKAFQ